MSGVVDDVRIENCKTGYYHALATVQMSNLQVVDVPKDGVIVSYYSGPLKLLNCNITPEQITPTKAAPAKAKDGVAADRVLALPRRSSEGEGARRFAGRSASRPIARCEERESRRGPPIRTFATRRRRSGSTA